MGRAIPIHKGKIRLGHQEGIYPWISNLRFGLEVSSVTLFACDPDPLDGCLDVDDWDFRIDSAILHLCVQIGAVGFVHCSC